MPGAIHVSGLAEFRRDLLRLDKEWSATEGLKRVHNAAAEIVASETRTRLPSRSGRAVGSVRTTSTPTNSQITEGGKRVPYVPWLDFGGRVGPKRSVHRPFIKTGRALYPAFEDRRKDVQEVLESEMIMLIRKIGWDVSTDGG
jgi:hypothetical protein